MVVLTGQAVSASATTAPRGDTAATGDTAVLRDYASRTWASITFMTDAATGLPADSLGDDGARGVQTSTTKIGAYLWSAVAARNVGLIGSRELVARLSVTLRTLERMDRDASRGQFYNWYEDRTGAVLTTWPAV